MGTAEQAATADGHRTVKDSVGSNICSLYWLKVSYPELRYAQAHQS